VLRALEAEDLMKVLFPAWTAAKADEERLKALHELAVELLLQGVHADMSAAQMQLLTAKLPPKDLSALKKLMLCPGFTEEWNSLDSLAAGFAKALLAKENANPSAGYKLFTSYDPEAVLWLGFTSKSAPVLERFNQFLKVWPEARQRIPHALMQEMRITPELAAYGEIIHAIFLELIDGRLTTPEEMRTFLEPHSPPAPPPQVTIKRPRAKRGAEAKVKEQSYDDEDESEDSLGDDDDLDDIGGDEDEIDMGMSIPKVDLDVELDDEPESGDDALEDLDAEPVPAVAKPSVKKAQKPAPPIVKAEKHAKAEKPQPGALQKTRPAVKSAAPVSKPTAPPVKVKHLPAPGKVAAKHPVKALAKLPAKPPAKAPVKAVAKPQGKVVAKTPTKPAAKAQTKALAKGKPAHAVISKSKTAAHAKKKPAPKPAKKR